MDGRLTVRRAVAEDEPFALALCGRFAETRPDWRTEAEITEGTAVALRGAFAAEGSESAIFVAETEHGEREGFVFVVLDSDFFTGEAYGHVSEIAVTRDGSGAGRLLMAAAEQYFRELGVRFVTLNVNERNERGLRFYERLGFEPYLRQLVKVL